MEVDCGPALILRDSKLLKVIKNIKTLKNIWIQFGAPSLSEDTDISLARRCHISFRGFRNLTSLEFYNICAPHERLAKEIASVLGLSQQLKYLGIGLACDSDYETIPETLLVDPDEQTFLVDLCDQYSLLKDTQPLALQSLRLGHGLFLYDVQPDGSQDFLEKLVDLRVLKTLHIFNGEVEYLDLMDDSTDSTDIRVEWSLFKDCTSLQQLSISTLNSGARQWLLDSGKSVRELIITDEWGIYEDDMEDFFASTGPHLSMLYLAQENLERLPPDDPWTDTDSSTTDTIATDMIEPELEDLSSTEELHDESVPSSLQPIRYCGAHLTRLALYLNFDTQLVSENQLSLERY